MIIGQSHRRAGLTLLELIIVLIILVALAGLVLPMFPDLITRSRTATGATNIREVLKAVDTYIQMDPRYKHPDGWDALTDGTALVSYLPAAGGKILAAPLTSAEIAGLNAVSPTGAFSVYLMQASVPASQPAPPAEPFSTTFNPYTTAITAATPLTDSIAVAQIDSSLATYPQTVEKLGLDVNGKYVLFGVGRRSSMMGKSMREVPVNSSDNPEVIYGRFLVIYQVADGSGPLNPARMVGAVGLRPDDIQGVGQHIQDYHRDAIK